MYALAYPEGGYNVAALDRRQNTMEFIASQLQVLTYCKYLL